MISAVTGPKKRQLNKFAKVKGLTTSFDFDTAVLNDRDGIYMPSLFGFTILESVRRDIRHSLSHYHH